MERHATERSVASELARHRARMFVGRGAEKRLFARLLRPAGGLRALYVHGIGGVGKTTLLNEFQRLAENQATAVLRVDARDLPAVPEELRRSLSFFTRGDAGGAVRVLLLDNFEHLAPLEAWFREAFLAHLQAGRRVVVAGRKPPAPAWQTDPGWAALTRPIELDALSRAQARDYLQRRGVLDARRGQVLGFARGHPLALALAAEVLVHQPDAPLPPEAEGEILELMMAQLLQGIEAVEQLQALRAAAIARELSEPLLAHMLAVGRAHLLYDWLQQLSFVHSGSNGLIVHSLLRDAITFDLRRRDRLRYDQMAGRAYRFLLQQMAARPPAQCGPATVDVFFVQRDTPLAQTIYRFEEERHCYCDTLAEGDWPRIQDMVLQHEGQKALEVLDRWVQLQPDGLVAVRATDQALAGFLYKLELNGLRAEDAVHDPVVMRYLEYLDTRASMQAYERALLFRSWMAADTYQALSAVQTQVCAYILFATLTTPDLAYILHLQPDVEAWTRISAQCGQTRLPGPPETTGSYRTALYAHDYREQSPLQWMCGLHRILRALPGPSALPLNEAAFAAAVRQALKDYASTHALADNPLIRASLVAEHPDAVAQSPVAILQGLLRQHCERLQDHPKTQPLYRVLQRTYLQPERNQALAADALYLSERTYRRRLAQALDGVIASLWLDESGGIAVD